MGFLKKIVETLFGSSQGEVKDSQGIYFYVKCSRCGTPLRIRADKHHDLQRDYDTGEYVLRKEIMDGSCFSLMQATIRFDPSYRIVDRQIDGGEFISWEEYQALASPAEETAETESSEP